MLDKLLNRKPKLFRVEFPRDGGDPNISGASGRVTTIPYSDGTFVAVVKAVGRKEAKAKGITAKTAHDKKQKRGRK